MCTARTKLKEVENEMDCLYAELRSVKMDRDQAIKEKVVAEADARFTHARNMFLTKKADIANLWMIFACIGFVISVGFLVYGL